MPNPKMFRISQKIHVALFTATAILCSLFCNLSAAHDRRTELYSEALCWMILPALIIFGQKLEVCTKSDKCQSFKYNNSAGWPLWLIASGIAMSCLCAAEAEVAWIMPTVVPLFMTFQQYYPVSKLSSQQLGPIYGPTAVAVFAFSTGIILDRDTILYSVPALISTFAVLVTLQILTMDENNVSSPAQLEHLFQCLSWRVLLALVIAIIFQTNIYGPSTLYIGPIIQNALFKLALWISLCQIAPSTSWNISSAIQSFSILSDISRATSSSFYRALIQTTVSFFPLQQSISMLPQSVKVKSFLWTFWLIPLTSFITTELAIRQSAPSYLGSLVEHPTEHLVRKGKSRFANIIAHQSRTYEEAHREYVRRYGMQPPPGFEAWFDFAAYHESPIIDEFDGLQKSLKPFYALSGVEVVDLMQSVRDAPGHDLWHCALGGIEGSPINCSHAWRVSGDRGIGSSLSQLLSDNDIRLQMPAVEFLINPLDEPAVLIPYDSLGAVSNYTGLPPWQNVGREPSWKKLTQFCEEQKSPYSSKHEGAVTEVMFQNISYNDICEHPEYEKQHGFFQSPPSFLLIEAPVPILSTGALSTMGDILFPSPAYAEPGFKYERSADIDWEKKVNKLFWAGSTTGGYAGDDNWHNFHRQRFVNLCQNLEKKQHQYLRVENGVLKSLYSSFLNLRLYDVALTKIFGCERKACSDMNAYFRKKGWVNRNRSLKFKFVFDIDGNGISGRFYQFLASNSVPLKQTIFREWHDDRLVPWVHYVPVSLGMEELPELVSYLSSSGEGMAKEIANQGAEWYSKAFREVDKSIYLYRLILEMARLQDPARKAGES